MNIICIHCRGETPLSAGFADEDGKALAELYGQLSPDCARALDQYLRLFKPRKTRLSNARELKLAREITPFILHGSFKRAGESYQASEADWTAAMEKLAASPPIKLPLASHGYLVEVVISTLAERKNKERAERDALARTQRENESDRFSSARREEDRVPMAPEIAAALQDLSKSLRAEPAKPVWRLPPPEAKP